MKSFFSTIAESILAQNTFNPNTLKKFLFIERMSKRWSGLSTRRTKVITPSTNVFYRFLSHLKVLIFSLFSFKCFNHVSKKANMVLVPWSWSFVTICVFSWITHWEVILQKFSLFEFLSIWRTGKLNSCFDQDLTQNSHTWLVFVEYILIIGRKLVLEEYVV